MEIRQATEGDSERIKEIAELSFRASYGLSPQDIEAIVAVEFESDPLVPRLDEEGRWLLVAETEGGLAGFVEGHLASDGTGEIVWLHVAPTERGYGIGTELFERVLGVMRERVAEEVRATVLAENQEGGEFFEQFEFESRDQRDRDIGELTLNVEVYSSEDFGRNEQEYTVPKAEEISVEGTVRYLDAEEAISGDESEILPVFESVSREQRFGFYCTNCGTFTDSVDGQGKVVCENCGNEHRPEQWDESYL